MTFVGKLLVFVNFALSVVFLGFAGATYTARLNLEDTIGKKQKIVDVEQKKSAELTADNGNLSTELKNVSAKLDDEKKSAEKSRKDKDQLIANAIEQSENFRKQLDQVNQRVVQVAEEASRRKEEVDQLRKIRQEQVEKINGLVLDVSNARDEVAKQKNDNEILTGRSREMAEENRLVKLFIQRQGVPLPDIGTIKSMESGNDATPPPEVEGIVKNVNGKFVEISLGENDGVKAGHMLKVWRMKPQPKYLGEIKVWTTQVNSAVAKPVSVTGMLLEGDRVGANVIMNR